MIARIGPTPPPLDICTKCGKQPAAMERGVEKLCWKCMGIDPNTVPKEFGGKGIVLSVNEGPSPAANDSNLIPLGKFKTPKLPTVKGVDVVFLDDKGQKHLIRTTQEEQDDIAKRLINNRATGHKAFQFANVVVLNVEVAIAMDEIIRKAAAGDADVQEKAKAFLEGLKKQEEP